MLGALLISHHALGGVRLDARLLPADFHDEARGHVYEAILELYDEGTGIDPLTVEQRMQERGWPAPAGGVEDLAGYVPAAGNARHYAHIVSDLALKRTLLSESYAIQEGIASGQRSARDLIEQAERRMLHVSDASVSELGRLDSKEELGRLEGIREGQMVVGVPTGFIDVDKLTSGLHPGNLVVLAARPSIGKTAWLVNVAENVAAKGQAVALFSLEMSRQEILRRMIASRARVSGQALLRGPIPPDEWERVIEAVQEITSWNMFVDDAGDTGVMDMRVKARRLKSRADLKLVLVDYIQLMRVDGQENRNIEIGKISRDLKLLAKDLAVPVIAVSQLSRQVEQRTDKHPVLSDLRDSGSIEQDADVVMFLYRDAVYNPDAAEDVGELQIAKHRNGPVGKVNLAFLGKYPKFANYIAPDAPIFGGDG